MFTTNREAHLYFAPRTVNGQVTITRVPADPDSVPLSLPNGAQRLLRGYDLAWEPGPLHKDVLFDLCFAPTCDSSAATPPAGARLALYRIDGEIGFRIGGTVEPSTNRIYASIAGPGRYALYADHVDEIRGAALAGLSLSPRVFSAAGTFANNEVAIGFTLGREGAVTVKVYDRAGRLVRNVVSARAMGPGAGLVRWDGRDLDGRMVPDGMFIVSVEAAGERLSKPLAVVR